MRDRECTAVLLTVIPFGVPEPSHSTGATPTTRREATLPPGDVGVTRGALCSTDPDLCGGPGAIPVPTATCTLPIGLVDFCPTMLAAEITVLKVRIAGFANACVGERFGTMFSYLQLLSCSPVWNPNSTL